MRERGGGGLLWCSKRLRTFFAMLKSLTKLRWLVGVQGDERRKEAEVELERWGGASEVDSFRTRVTRTPLTRRRRGRASSDAEQRLETSRRKDRQTGKGRRMSTVLDGNGMGFYSQHKRRP
jgi:hypothetical protein